MSDSIILQAMSAANPYPTSTHSVAHALWQDGVKKCLEHQLQAESPDSFLGSYPEKHPTREGYIWCQDWINNPNGECKEFCQSCKTELFIQGGMGGTNLCGPCCTGESETLEEIGITW
ncbi:hypothetical protein [Nodosilinea nodulosa]|uniref:hypothetical protein n=1 Tax=Nodosilinea nodulosa TaxID=416001 RepID=UPI0012D77E15|nr:hypothetical protein [Nodosilinea nodulosa]